MQSNWDYANLRKNKSITMMKAHINLHFGRVALTLLCTLALCGNWNKMMAAEYGNRNLAAVDTLDTDTAGYAGSVKALNDIRFANFEDKDWLDNDYIRCLRQYLDDYNKGKIEDKSLDPYKEKLKGQFVIGWSEPALLGGLMLQIIFVDSPADMFAAWVYSGVDEETETVLDYEVRFVTLNEEKTGYTKEQILDIVKEHPEFKLW